MKPEITAKLEQIITNFLREKGELQSNQQARVSITVQAFKPVMIESKVLRNSNEEITTRIINRLRHIKCLGTKLAREFERGEITLENLNDWVPHDVPLIRGIGNKCLNLLVRVLREEGIDLPWMKRPYRSLPPI
jgi:hypothetical protein